MGPATLSLVLQAAYAVLTFLIGLVLARSLAPALFGEFSYVQAWLLLAAGILQGGVPALIVRELAAYRAVGRVGATRGLVAASRFYAWGVFTFVGVAGVSVWIIDPSGLQSKALLFVGIPAVVLVVWLSVDEHVVRGFGHLIAGQIGQLLIRPASQLAILCGVVFVGGQLSASEAMGTFTVSLAIACIYTSYRRSSASKSIGADVREYDWAAWRYSALQMSGVSWLSALSLQANFILIGVISTDAVLGEYRAAYQMSILAALGLTGVKAIVAPRFGEAFARRDSSSLADAYRLSVALSLAAAVPVVAVLAVWGRDLLSFAYGADYGPGYGVLVVLALAVLVNACFGAIELLLYGAREEGAVAQATMLRTATNVVVCVALIPSMGGMGAALGHLAGIVVWCLFMWRRTHNRSVLATREHPS